jgi:hypothetical protein
MKFLYVITAVIVFVSALAAHEIRQQVRFERAHAKFQTALDRQDGPAMDAALAKERAALGIETPVRH